MRTIHLRQTKRRITYFLSLLGFCCVLFWDVRHSPSLTREPSPAW